MSNSRKARLYKLGFTQQSEVDRLFHSLPRLPPYLS